LLWKLTASNNEDCVDQPRGISRQFRVVNRYVGKLPRFPQLHGPVVAALVPLRERVAMRWDMPPPKFMTPNPLISWWLQLAGQPAHSIGNHWINWKGTLLNPLASRAFKCAFFVAVLSGRNSRQPQSVLTGWIHRPDNRRTEITHTTHLPQS
jgi:hypothetical protein